ncbi:tRNA (guanosine(46)-N7)-methyltransferase TrmB [Neomicrococcus aestuarii]|uniref:tRNA (guanine-N(7)-)-methyltransferase n=1 Tax=Neomicrococcus aestuarii TaxID=556325 RepID=A0A1L2ZQA1_9MICC|nr:tRNA (guanosine(46)-N7)-methyltransferase TrmB [Neomicrococcus aestuarii]APF41360.1 tRNA (guanosine(46)-N7)-methyltransferase TrmB [Neomicrococcus aestuarii]
MTFEGDAAPASKFDSDLYRSEPVSFVRRGTRLQGRRLSAWEKYADQFLIEVPRHIADTSVSKDFDFDDAAHFGRTAPLVIEVGSGLGEAMVARAAEEPERNFLAVEVYRPGLAQLMLKAGTAGLTNVRCVQANAPEVFDVLDDGSVDEVWVFFPDPWHKARHNKRRLVNDAFAARVARVLRPGGLWRLATDWDEYADQMLEVLTNSPDFENLHESWAPRFEGRIVTSFETKAHKAGRTIHDLTFRRVEA